jgi:Uri superfamily endonuclease
MNQGVYALVIQNREEQEIRIGKLGTFIFLEGYYVYIGSALGKTATNLKNRLKRHMSKNKTLHWHIDFFLNTPNTTITRIIYANTTEPKECFLASSISKNERVKILIKKFGASDCKSNCGSHLFYFPDTHERLINLIHSAFLTNNLIPKTLEPNIFHDGSNQ